MFIQSQENLLVVVWALMGHSLVIQDRNKGKETHSTQKYVNLGGGPALNMQK